MAGRDDRGYSLVDLLVALAVGGGVLAMTATLLHQGQIGRAHV